MGASISPAQKTRERREREVGFRERKRAASVSSQPRRPKELEPK
jgi:hypothetical protein